MGVAITPGQIAGQNPTAMALILKQYDCISPRERPQVGSRPSAPGQRLEQLQFRPGRQRSMLSSACKNHLWIIGHNLCWHSQEPELAFPG